MRSAVSSYDTPIMLRPFASRSFCIALSDGISDRQGMHQVAQKLSSTTRPRRSRKRNGLPSSFVNCTSGAAVYDVFDAVFGAGFSLLLNWNLDSRFGRIFASRVLESNETRLLITSAPIRIRMTPETTSTLCKCWRNFERSEEHTSELQSRFGISYAVFCLE